MNICELEPEYPDFDPDYEDPRLKCFDLTLIHFMSDEIAEFASRALRDRTYDAEAVLGSTWETYGADVATLLKALSVLTSLDNCPLVSVRQTKGSHERYAIR